MSEDSAGTVKTAADLRADIGRHRIVMYKLAAKVGIWPGTLGQMVNERIPLPVGMAKKIEEAIEAYIAEDTK